MQSFFPEILLLVAVIYQVGALAWRKGFLMRNLDLAIVSLLFFSALGLHIYFLPTPPESFFGGAFKSDVFFRWARMALLIPAILLIRFAHRSLMIPERRKRELILFITAGVFFSSLLLLSQNLLATFLVGLGMACVSLLASGMSFHDAEEGEAAFKAWAQLSLAVVLGLSSLLVLIMVGGGLEYVALAEFLAQSSGASALALVLLLLLPLWVLLGFFPFHAAILDRDHGAPWPVQAFSAACIAPAASLGLFRACSILFSKNTDGLMFVSCISWLAAFWLILAAATQKNTKRLLAFFFAAQYALALALFSKAGAITFSAVQFWILSAQWSAIILFPVLGYLQEMASSEERSAVYGLGRHHLLGGIMLLLGFSNLLLMPLLPGFYSAQQAISALFEQQSLLRLMALASCIILMVLVVLRLLSDVFFRAPSEQFLRRWPHSDFDFMRYTLWDKILFLSILLLSFAIGFGSDRILAALMASANAFII